VFEFIQTPSVISQLEKFIRQQLQRSGTFRKRGSYHH